MRYIWILLLLIPMISLAEDLEIDVPDVPDEVLRIVRERIPTFQPYIVEQVRALIVRFAGDFLREEAQAIADRYIMASESVRQQVRALLPPPPPLTGTP